MVYHVWSLKNGAANLQNSKGLLRIGISVLENFQPVPRLSSISANLRTEECNVNSARRTVQNIKLTYPIFINKVTTEFCRKREKWPNTACHRKKISSCRNAEMIAFTFKGKGYNGR